MNILPTPTKAMLARSPEEAREELLDAWQGPTHPAVRQRRGRLLVSALTAFAGPFILAGAIYWVSLRELGIITAVTVRRHALDLLCIAVMFYAVWALQLIEDTILFCGATELLARFYARAHQWLRRRPMSWRKLIALNERKPKKPRKRFDEECLVLFIACGVLGFLALAIYIPAIGA